jgi:hypothetical protein
MSIYIYYHITCFNNWKDVVREQLTRVIFSGLYDKVNEIRCYAIIPYVDNENKELDEDVIKEQKNNYLKIETEKLRLYLNTIGNKIILLDTSCRGYESFTMQHIPVSVNDDDIVFYFHTKGVTRHKSTNFIFNEIYEYTIPELETNIQNWKDCLDYILIKNHERCLSLIRNEHFSTVGVNAYTSPYHYSGHYWWACGEYLKTLEPIKNKNNYNNESWLLSNIDSTKHHASLLNNNDFCNYFYSEPLSVMIKEYIYI